MTSNYFPIYTTAVDVIQRVKDIGVHMSAEGLELPITIKTEIGDIYIHKGYQDETMHVDISWKLEPKEQHVPIETMKP